MTHSRVGSFLIVEPDATTAAVLAGLCRTLRTARVVSTRREAVEFVATRPRLTGLIMEPELPDGSGLEVLRAVRGWQPLLPALVLTSNTSAEVINRAHHYRAEFHAKPTHRRALTGFVRRAVAFERVPDQRIAWLVEESVLRYKLSPRETDALAAAIAGTPRKELSEQLGMTDNSLKSVIKGALRKLPQSSLDETAREILRQALEGSHATTLEEYFERVTPISSGPPTIPPSRKPEASSRD